MRLKVLVSKQSDLANLASRIGMFGTHPSSGHTEDIVEVSSTFIYKVFLTCLEINVLKKKHHKGVFIF